MKQCFKIVLALFLFSNISFSQFYAEEEISPYIIEFMKIAKETTHNYDDYRNPKNKFTDTELEHIAKLYYHCYNDDPVGFNNYVTNEHQKWETRVSLSEKKSKVLRPWMKVYAIRNQIAYKYGIPFTTTISTPAFLRGEFLLLSRSSYSSDLGPTIGQRNFSFLIEEIIKGDKFFNIGDTIIVSMFPHREKPSPNLTKDESYLVAVTPLIGKNEYRGEVTFAFQNTFPIENEIIKDCEYFGIIDTNWVDFKKFFKEKYLIFD